MEPLKGQINPDTSDFTVGKVKVEIRLAKMAPSRWGGLIGDAPDRKWIGGVFVGVEVDSLLQNCHRFQALHLLRQRQENLTKTGRVSLRVFLVLKKK